MDTCHHHYSHHHHHHYGFGSFIFDAFMVCITGGFWFIWIFIREMRKQ